MDKNIIRNAKKQYIELINSREELLKIKSELLKENQNQKIKKCLKLIECEENTLSNEEEILRHCFYSHEDENSNCNIYVFVGAYRRNKNIDDKVLDYSKADYFVYQNLEKMFSGVVIYPQQQKQFEIDNIILKFKDSDNIKEKFNKLQYIYFKEYLQNENITDDKVLQKLKENL